MNSAGSSQETILIVEDDPEVLQMVTSILKSAGYQVLCAHNGDEALKAARQQDGAIDLVLTDIVMPGMSGGELVRRLQLIKPKIHSLYMSGYTKYTVVSPGTLESVNSFIWKPFTPSDLLLKVREVMEAPEETL
jgi:two-component system, cell cycle sensor histidine kinase and response regulator CckA